MATSYIKLIKELDSVLGMVRSLWMDATTVTEKARWMTRLNELLDERLRLMAERDAC